MKTVGLFEAKTKLSEVCAEVADSGAEVVVTRRGKPWVRIAPVQEATPMTVRERREAYLASEPRRAGKQEAEFQVPERAKDTPRGVRLDG
jgi:prevent-host-death family protein